MQLVEKHGGDATVLTLGPAEADEQLRYAASLGVAKAVLLPIDGAGLGSAANRRRDRRGDRRHRGGRRRVRPDPVRQRVGRLRRVPGRRPCRACARPSDRQRDQGHRGAKATALRARREADVGVEVVRGADAGGARRQGGHQPAPLSDAEGAARLEEGRRRPGRADGRARWPADDHAAAGGRAGQRDGHPRATAPMRQLQWSTCSKRSACSSDPGRRRARSRHDVAAPRGRRSPLPASSARRMR